MSSKTCKHLEIESNESSSVRGVATSILYFYFKVCGIWLLLLSYFVGIGTLIFSIILEKNIEKASNF